MSPSLRESLNGTEILFTIFIEINRLFYRGNKFMVVYGRSNILEQYILGKMEIEIYRILGMREDRDIR